MAQSGMRTLRCHAPSGPDGRRCDAVLGGTETELRVIGVFIRWEGETGRSAAREVKRCEACGWYNIFEVVRGQKKKTPR